MEVNLAVVSCSEQFRIKLFKVICRFATYYRRAVLPGLLKIAETLQAAIEAGKFDEFINTFVAGQRFLGEVTVWVVFLITDHFDIVQSVLLALGMILAALTAI